MLDTKNALKKISKFKAKNIFLQIPEGLKTQALEMVSALEKEGLEVFISVDPCYGACDLRDHEAKALGCDVILHVGHSDYGLKSRIPVIYEEFEMNYDPVPLLKNFLHDLKPYNKISLVTTVQFLSSLGHAKKFLQKRGKRVFIGSSKRGKAGQVLGCDFSAAKSLERVVDCFLFMGSGTFHPLGLAMEMKKPVFFLDFEGSQLLSLKDEKRRMENIRLMQIEKAKSCKNFGVLGSTKPGQMRVRTAEGVKERLSELGKNSWILVADEITPEKLLGLQIDCLVNTACPRLREDSRFFKKPILEPRDVEKLSE
ncbi:MAG: diphthamide biosynthesis enzyme Dph2 [Candidatus Aenigmatarchaeota archaeon]|nr:MAG: diphthamide biosynthesis enzyme Dph2 [Candidatus Aenigmarchaeota archaeon]